MIKERNSSFELLRLILMFMIVMHHFIVHGFGMPEMANGENIGVIRDDYPLFFTVNGLLICAVNAFVLISGYFGIKSGWKKSCRLLFMILFYTILFTTLPLVASGKLIEAGNSLLIISHTNYWFVVDYLFLLICAPMINVAFERWTCRQKKFFVLLLLIVSCYLGFVWKYEANVNGYALFQFITMYCLGRVIREFNFSMKGCLALAGYVGSSLLIGYGVYKAWSSGDNVMAWKFTYYNNPLNVFAAVCLVMWFRNLRFNSKFINRAAKSVLAVYLVQESGGFRLSVYDFLREKLLSDAPGVEVLLIFVVITVALMAGAIVFDYIPQSIYGKLEKKYFDKKTSD